MIRTALKVAFVAMLVLVVLAPAQRRRRDPLTEAETEQLREVSPESDQKLKLLVKFARARLTDIEQLRADPKPSADRSRRLHDLLEDFANIVDELDDNVASFVQRKADLRKPLKAIIEADSGFQLKLQALKQAASDPKAGEEAKHYEFVLETAIESVEASLDNARDLLDKQNAAFAAEKEKEKAKKR